MAIKRQQIMDAIASRVALILTASGYYFDLGLNVIESRPQIASPDGSVGRAPVDPSECPCILLRDPMDTITQLDLSGGEEHNLSVEIEIRHEGGTITDSDLRQMEQDIRRAIGVDRTWGGLAMDTVPNTSEKLLLQADKILGGVLMKISILFTTSAFGEE